MVKPKLMIATPCSTSFPYQYVDSITKTLLRLYDKYALGIGLYESPLVYSNRNQLFRRAYDDGVDYILFIDSDMDWSPEMIDKLVMFDKDVACGLCLSRKPLMGDAHIPTILFKVDGRYRAYNEIPSEPLRVDAAGMAFVLIKKNVIKTITEKYPHPFNPIYEGDRLLGEDISFCERLRECGFDIWCDPSCRIGHLVQTSLGKG